PLVTLTSTFSSALPSLPSKIVSSFISFFAHTGSDFRFNFCSLGGVPLNVAEPEMVPPANAAPEASTASPTTHAVNLRVLIVYRSLGGRKPAPLRDDNPVCQC